MARRSACALSSLVVLVASTLATPSVAQGALPMAGTWRIGTIGGEFGSPPACGGSGAVVFSATGTITLRADGTFNSQQSAHEVCQIGVSFASSESDAGVYEVFEPGVLELDYNPVSPGTDTETFFVRPDGSAFVNARDDVYPDAWMSIALRGSTGQANSSLNGDYHVMRLTQRAGAGGRSEGDLGVIRFNGAGGFTDSGQRQIVQLDGTTTQATYSGSGSYTVASDGALTVSGLDQGAISPTGEVFFYVTGTGATTALTVGVRRGTGLDSRQLRGFWGIGGYEIELGTSIDVPGFYTWLIVAEIDRTGPQTSDYDLVSLEVETTPLGTFSYPGSGVGTATIQPDGAVSFLELGATLPSPGAVSSDGTFVLVRLADSALNGFEVGVRLPAAPAEYGPATPGTGGFAPRTVQSGMPLIGSSSFGVGVVEAAGSAPCVLLFAAGDSFGIPLLGGTILLDPALFLVSVPIALSGTPGVAGVGEGNLGLPIPNTAFLDRAMLYVQAITFDSAAPAAIAMSRGFAIELGI